MTRRPNFILFITDQHRADHLGSYGNAIVRTPHIDGIAGRGTRFGRFYVANPVCMPNRASLMTGRMPSLHGVRHNGIALSREDNSFVDVLAAAGYRTALVGKSHLQNFTGAPPVLRFAEAEGRTPPPAGMREATRHIRAGPGYDSENRLLWRDDPDHRVAEPFYGFGHTRICTGHGDQVGGHYSRWLGERHPDPESLRGPVNAMGDNRYGAPQAWRTRVPEALYPTTYVAEMAEEFLAGHAGDGGDDPFFLQVSFPDPHHPFTPPGRYWDMFDPDAIPLPDSFNAGDLPPLRALREALQRGDAVRTRVEPFAVTEREAREIIALTYGMIAMIDDAVGRVLDRLAALGCAEDTVIAFTSDHGDYMGDHGIMLKFMMHYQGLIRVPFIWADPASPGGGDESSSLSGTIDIAPTILGRAGLQPYNGMQGRDLFDPAAAAPDGVVVEEDPHREFLQFGATHRVRTLVTARWRLTVHDGFDWGELYDLEADPGETANLWHAPEAAGMRAELTEMLLRRMIQLQDRSPLPTGRA